MKRFNTKDDNRQQRKNQRLILRPSSVTVGGTDYMSDRFYIHGKEEERNKDLLTGCSCGFDQPPPLFDREIFLQSLELEAAIFGTYSVNLNWMMKTFPQFIGPRSTIPTLILHGTKGLNGRLSSSLGYKKEQSSTRGEAVKKKMSDFIPSFCTTTTCFGGDDTYYDDTYDDTDTSQCTEEDLCSIFTQEESSDQTFSSSCWKLKSPPRSRPPLKKRSSNTIISEFIKAKNPKKNRPNPKSSRGGNTEEEHLKEILGEKFHLTEIRTTCSDSSETVTHENEKKQSQEYKRGVYHPKFMLLFEKTGDLIVVVSTANLCQSQNTTEGSWVQRFKKKIKHVRYNSQKDFGESLQDFLEKLSRESVKGQMTVKQFLLDYLHFPLRDLKKKFHFENAEVTLIPVIPKTLSPGELDYTKYGRERVRHVLSRLDFLPKSKTEDLLIQPTSFGANWKPGEMAHVVKSYMGCQSMDEDKILERLKIVWPSTSFVKDHSWQANGDKNLVQNGSGVLFLSSEGFNRCDNKCLARMAHYENSHPLQRPVPFVAHFKSVARICRDANFPNIPKADEIFSFFLMSSACLSHGAQGRVENPYSYDPTPISYSNFELGVLFTSKYRGASKTKLDHRVYCFRPHVCCCENPNGFPTPKLVHLPVPYSLSPRLYMEETDDMMNDLPFFHELPEHPKLNPYKGQKKNKPNK